MGGKILIVLLIFIFELVFTTSALVQTIQAGTQNCPKFSTDPPDGQLIEGLKPLTTDPSVPEDERWVAFIIAPTDKSAQYKLVWEAGGLFGAGNKEVNDLRWDSNRQALVDANGGVPALKYPSPFLTPTTHKYYLERKGVSGKYCDSSYIIIKDVSGGIKDCTLTVKPPSLTETDSIELSGTISPQGDYQVYIKSKGSRKISLDNNGAITPLNLGQFNPDTYHVSIQKKTTIVQCLPGGACTPVDQYIDTNCQGTLKIDPSGGQGSFNQIGTPGPGGTVPLPLAKECKDKNDPTFDQKINIVCAKAGGAGCDIDPNTPGIQPDPNKPGFKTAIGCIHTNPADLIADVLKFALGIGGGLAFLMMLLGAFQMLTSAGNPETLAAGKDRLTSAVIGLLFIIFAVLLLQIIGADILGILKR